MAPAVSMAFPPVDFIPYPSRGAFPAYAAEARRLPEMWVQGGVMRDNNILRLQDGAQSDTVTRLGAGIRHEARVIGRQSVALEARFDHYSYDRFTNLDHTAYGLRGEWRWEVGNDLSGTLGYSRRRILVDFGEVQAAVKDLVTENRLYGTAAYRLGPNMRVRGALDHTRNNRSVGEAADTRGNGALIGLDYVTALGNSLGIEARTARGDAPVPEQVALTGTLVNNDFREHEVSAVATYSPNPQFRFAGRLGKTKRSYSELGGRDFSGTTWRASADWLPGTKTRLNFTAYKEPRSIIDIAAFHVLVKGVEFGPSWAPTPKIVLSGRVFREQRQYQGDPTLQLVPGTPMRDETLRGVRLGVGWEIQRNIEISAAVDRGERSSNLLGRNYDYTATMANLRFSF
jgi:hypothetical protein